MLGALDVDFRELKGGGVQEGQGIVITICPHAPQSSLSFTPKVPCLPEEPYELKRHWVCITWRRCSGEDLQAPHTPTHPLPHLPTPELRRSRRVLESLEHEIPEASAPPKP